MGSIFQLKRLLPKNEINERIEHLFETGEINSTFFESENEKNRYISGFIALREIKNEIYKENIYSYFKNFGHVYAYSYGEIGFSGLDTLSRFLSEELFCFYELDVFFSDFEILENVLLELELENVIDFVVQFYKYFKNNAQFIPISEKIIKEGISKHCDFVEASDYDDMDISHHVDIHETYTDRGSFFDEEGIVEAVEYDIRETIEDKIREWVGAIPWDFTENVNFDIPHISIYGADDLVESYFSHNDDYERERDYGSASDSDIDFIFER